MADREEEIAAFTPQEHWSLNLELASQAGEAGKDADDGQQAKKEHATVQQGNTAQRNRTHGTEKQGNGVGTKFWEGGEL